MSKITSIINYYKVDGVTVKADSQDGHSSDWKCDCKPKATRDGRYATVFHK